MVKESDCSEARTPGELIPCPRFNRFSTDGTAIGRPRRLMSSWPAMLFNDGSSMAPIIPQTDTMETWQNRAMRTAVFGACPIFRILLAVLLQKSSVMCDYLLLYN